MKKRAVLILVVSCVFGYGQVGINTTDPQATLDVNGNAMIRTVPDAPAAADYDFLVRNKTSMEVEKVNGNFSSPNFSNTIAKAVEEDGVSLLS